MFNLKSTWLNLRRHMPQFEWAWCFLPLHQIPWIKPKIMCLRVHASYWLHCREMKSDIEFVLNHGELLTTLFLGSGALIINHIMTAHVWRTGLWCNFWRSDFRGAKLEWMNERKGHCRWCISSLVPTLSHVQEEGVRHLGEENTSHMDAQLCQMQVSTDSQTHSHRQRTNVMY